jgi:hypothetical protein
VLDVGARQHGVEAPGLAAAGDDERPALPVLGAEGGGRDGLERQPERVGRLRG